MDSHTINQNHFTLRKSNKSSQHKSNFTWGTEITSSICMRATAVVKKWPQHPIGSFGGRVGVVRQIPNSIPLIRGSNVELQQPCGPWTWSSNRYVILQPFFTAALLGPALEERARERNSLQICRSIFTGLWIFHVRSRVADAQMGRVYGRQNAHPNLWGKMKRWFGYLTIKLHTWQFWVSWRLYWNEC